MEFYYKTFDADRTQLAALYGPDSMLTFEAAPIQGAASIVEKLNVRGYHEDFHTGLADIWDPIESAIQASTAPSRYNRCATEQSPRRYSGKGHRRADGRL